MKRMFKKVISVFLVFTMIFSVTMTTAGAATSVENIALADRVNAEIEQQKAVIFADIYKQLKEQDALSLMDEFVSAITPDIENAVLAKYNLPVTRASNGNLVMDGGGVMTYETSLHATVIKTCLLPNQAQKYLVSNTLLTMGKVINKILGRSIPHWTVSVGALLNMGFYLTDQNNKLIKSGKHVMCTQVKTAYESGIAFYEWNFPYGAIADAKDRNNYHVQYFY